MFAKYIKMPIVCAFALILAGCSFGEKNAISDSQFVNLYVDLSLAAEQFLTDSVKLASVQDSIFVAHKITRNQFDSYKINLDKSPERWSEIWNLVLAELNKREDVVKKDKSKTAQLPKSNKTAPK